jgi:hypothetical protein
MSSDILKTINFFHRDGTTFELCGLGPSVAKSHLWEGFASSKDGGVVAGWFNDKAKAVETATTLNKIGAHGIYVTLNECNSALLSRANNRLKGGIARTQDKEIEKIRWLLVDVDPRRPSGVSSTNQEHTLALEHAGWIGNVLDAKGWPKPLYADSGNGAHLIYRLPDMDPVQDNIDFVKSILQALNSLYLIRKDDITLDIDLKVFNPARISKLYGTHARKGDHTTERPWRLAKLIFAPENPEPVSRELLESLIIQAEQDAPPPPLAPKAGKARAGSRQYDSKKKFDLPAYLEKYAVDIREVKTHGESLLHVLQVCLFDSSHNGGEAAIGQTAEGKLFYQCFHDSCKARTWADAKKEISGEDSLYEFSGAGKKEPAGYEEILQCVEELNKIHAINMLGGKCVVMNEVIDPVFNRPDITFSSPADFKTRYTNQKIFVANSKGETKSIGIGHLWMEHEARKQYDGIVFSPDSESDNYFNLYRGFAVKPRKGSWDKLRNHIGEVICGNDDVIFDYIMAWMADTVQHPGGDLPGVSIVMKGGKGVGKGIFARTFGEIFGNHFLHITHQSQLTGKFNNHQKDALVVFADECFWAGDKQSENVLKAMITEPTIRVEPKGKDSYTVKNHMHVIIASNDSWVIPAGLGERRFLVVEVEDSHRQDINYFRPIYEEIANGGKEAMLYDLMEYEYNKQFLLLAPKTDALLAQIEEGLEPLQKFWLEKLKEGLLHRSEVSWTQRISTTKLYTDFLEFNKNIGFSYAPAPNAFSRRLRAICPGVLRKHTTVTFGGGREWSLLFPPLDACRAAFEKVLGQKIPWNEDNENGVPVGPVAYQSKSDVSHCN